MNYRYAEINDSDIVFNVFETTKAAVGENLISLALDAENPMGKKWNGSAFEAVPVVHDGAPDFPRATKTEFRALLTQNQKLVWDNYDLLKGTLDLTDEQFMAMRTFRADFELANVVDLTDDLMTQGLQTISSWGLQFGGGDLFPASEVERILEGRLP